MPNHFHLRANIDRLWKQANGNAPGYRQVKALDTIVRELYAPNDRARLNQRLYLATDPFDVARHKLRDLYDRPDTNTSPGSIPLPLPPGEGWGEGPPALAEEEPTEEDDDPL